MNAQFAALQAQLALIGIPAIAAAASASVQAIANARVVNNHYRSGVARRGSARRRHAAAQLAHRL